MVARRGVQYERKTGASSVIPYGATCLCHPGAFGRKAFGVRSVSGLQVGPDLKA